MLDEQGAADVETDLEHPSDDDEPVIEVEADAQNMSGEKAQAERDGRNNDGDDGSGNESVGNAAGVHYLSRSG